MRKNTSTFDDAKNSETAGAGAQRVGAPRLFPFNLINGNKIGSSLDQLENKMSVKPTDAHIKVYSKATYFPTYTKVYIPYEPYEVQKPEVIERKQKHAGNPLRTAEQKAEDVKRSINKTKSKIIEYVECNFFEWFATFTFREDREDQDKCRAKMANWLKLQRKRKGEFEYLIVPEFHKDGVSLHFHALIKDYKGEIRKASHNGKTSKRNYQFASYTLGFNNVRKIKDTPDSHSKVARYVSKYITKEMPLIAGKNRYWASQGLKTALHENNPKEFFADMEPSEEPYVGEFGMIYKFPYIHPSYAEQNNVER